MKKWYICCLLSLFLLIGCAPFEEKAEEEEIKTLMSYGLEEKTAKEFRELSNSVKTIFSGMYEINNTIEENGYTIEEDTYKKVLTASKKMEKHFISLNPKQEDEIKNYLSNSTDIMSSPVPMMDNMKESKRNFAIFEAAMLWNRMLNYTEESLATQNLSDENLEKIMQWYHKNNQYKGIFKQAYDYKKSEKKD